MSDSNTPDGAREEMLAALSRIQKHTITLETSLAASIKASGEYAAEIVTLKSERDTQSEANVIACQRVRELEAERDAAQARMKVLEGVLGELITDIDGLIGDSGGVYGLHMTDDPAPWDSITEGGAYEEHLMSLELAREALKENGQ